MENNYINWQNNSDIGYIDDEWKDLDLIKEKSEDIQPVDIKIQ
jgi:hypothetical protein